MQETLLLMVGEIRKLQAQVDQLQGRGAGTPAAAFLPGGANGADAPALPAPAAAVEPESYRLPDWAMPFSSPAMPGTGGGTLSA